MAIVKARHYPGISPKTWEHPADRAATAALAAIPLMDQVIKKLSAMSTEKMIRQLLLGNAVRVGETQLPELWKAHQHPFTVLDHAPVPTLYVTQTPFVNAFTVGADTPVVVLFSGLARDYTTDEVSAVMAHEAGHVVSEHYYYQTALLVLTAVMQGTLPASLVVGLPTRAIYMILLEWARTAELSCDRASAIVLGDPRPVSSMLMRLAGGAIPGLNVDAFIAQAMEYRDEDDLYSIYRRFWMESAQSHPLSVRRVQQLVSWVSTGDYDRIVAGSYVKKGFEPPPTEEFVAATRHYTSRFTSAIGKAGDSMRKVRDQMGRWLEKAGVFDGGDTAGADE